MFSPHPMTVDCGQIQRPAHFGFCAGFVGPPVAQRRPMSDFSFRLSPMIQALSNRFGADLSLIQLWTVVNGQEWSRLNQHQLRGVVAQTDVNPSAVQNPTLHSYRQKCCKQGIKGAALGMLGKAWSTGSACVIQNVETLPHTLHPRTYLEGGEGIADVVFIPIYDQLVSEGVCGVLEVLVNSDATDPMVVANTITFVGTLLNQLQMGLSRPQQQHPHPIGSTRHSMQQQQQQQQHVMAPGAQAGSVAYHPKHERSSSPTSPLDVAPAKCGPWMSRTTSMRNVTLA